MLWSSAISECNYCTWCGLIIEALTGKWTITSDQAQNRAVKSWPRWTQLGGGGWGVQHAAKDTEQWRELALCTSSVFHSAEDRVDLFFYVFCHIVFFFFIVLAFVFWYSRCVYVIQLFNLICHWLWGDGGRFNVIWGANRDIQRLTDRWLSVVELNVSIMVLLYFQLYFCSIFSLFTVRSVIVLFSSPLHFFSIMQSGGGQWKLHWNYWKKSEVPAGDSKDMSALMGSAFISCNCWSLYKADLWFHD